MRISDWSSDVCSSDLAKLYARKSKLAVISAGAAGHLAPVPDACRVAVTGNFRQLQARNQALGFIQAFVIRNSLQRSEEHTSELQSLMRISYAVFCLKKKKYAHYNTASITYKHKQQ